MLRYSQIQGQPRTKISFLKVMNIVEISTTELRHSYKALISVLTIEVSQEDARHAHHRFILHQIMPRLKTALRGYQHEHSVHMLGAVTCRLITLITSAESIQVEQELSINRTVFMSKFHHCTSEQSRQSIWAI